MKFSYRINWYLFNNPIKSEGVGNLALVQHQWALDQVPHALWCRASSQTWAPCSGAPSRPNCPNEGWGCLQTTGCDVHAAFRIILPFRGPCKICKNMKLVVLAPPLAVIIFFCNPSFFFLFCLGCVLHVVMVES